MNNVALTYIWRSWSYHHGKCFVSKQKNCNGKTCEKQLSNGARGVMSVVMEREDGREEIKNRAKKMSPKRRRKSFDALRAKNRATHIWVNLDVGEETDDDHQLDEIINSDEHFDLFFNFLWVSIFLLLILFYISVGREISLLAILQKM